jgi:penicillin-binding protein 2
MKAIRWVFLFLLLLLVACGRSTVTPGPTPTSTVSSAVPTILHTPSVETSLKTFLDALVAENYATMYNQITQAARGQISLADFTKRYTDALNAMSASSIDYTILSTLTAPQAASASFQITYKTVLFGDIGRSFNASFTLEDSDWRLQWSDGLILPELAGGKILYAAHVSPARGDIYDRSGNAIATQTDIYSLGLVAGGVANDSEDAVLHHLWQLTGIRPEIIRNAYENYAAGNYVPVGEASASAVKSSGILGFDGLYAVLYTSRFYEPNLAPQAVGYTQAITQEELNSYLRLGYSQDAQVGQAGIERWGETYLHGRDAATLYVASTDNTLESALAQVESQPAASIYTTIDSDLQQQAQAAMDGLPGAIVVMEVNTGKVLAMVSSPGEDPNWYDVNNYNRQWMDMPSTFNRASQGQYPLGSVFKLVTISAALESGVFTPQSTYQCGYEFDDIPGHTLYDWTYERCQAEEAETGKSTCTRPNSKPSGLLTLPQGLMRSCDPWFYHIGLELYDQGKGNLISDMAKAFGLGKATGIGQVAEAEGVIPDPTDGLDATSIAIGQGDVQVTPLQVATFISAIANGGILYRPQLVEKVQPVSGDPVYSFQPQVNGTLPVKPENLKVIQDAMRTVAANPLGTAYYTLGDFSIPTAAKTGTAESSAVNPDAWFAGYSMVGGSDKPDIAVVVLVENKGEGATWAAPIFRRIMEIYFLGHPQRVYPWETTFGVMDPNYGLTATPTPTP